MFCWSNNLILDMLIFINSNIFHHSKLEIALEIPGSNDEKYNWSKSAGQGLKRPRVRLDTAQTTIQTLQSHTRGRRSKGDSGTTKVNANDLQPTIEVMTLTSRYEQNNLAYY